MCLRKASVYKYLVTMYHRIDVLLEEITADISEKTEIGGGRRTWNIGKQIEGMKKRYHKHNWQSDMRLADATNACRRAGCHRLIVETQE
jgi:hypothetical protein